MIVSKISIRCLSQKVVSVFTGQNNARCHGGRANYNRTEAIKQTTFPVVTKSCTLSSDLQSCLKIAEDR